MGCGEGEGGEGGDCFFFQDSPINQSGMVEPTSRGPGLKQHIFWDHKKVACLGYGNAIKDCY